MDPVITLTELQEELAGPHPPIIIDTRNPERYAAGHIPGALNIQVRQLQSQAEPIPRGRPVVTY